MCTLLLPKKYRSVGHIIAENNAKQSKNIGIVNKK